MIAGALALAAAVPAADAAIAQDRDQDTTLITRARDGRLPNGPSRNAVISHDFRIGRVIAFDSNASNLVAGDLNGLTDVFAVLRGGSYGKNGDPWQPGRTLLVSKGRKGKPANGRSYGPAVDGRPPNRVPTCIAFVSEASNLVKKDTNKRADAFVYNLKSRGIKRVSVSSSGKQANGSTYDVAVDGECTRVAFTSDATNLALTKTRNRIWKRARTRKVKKKGVRQVYVRGLGGKGIDRKLKGLTFLASASSSGRPGNRHSSDPSFAFYRRGITFESEASNLTKKDKNAASDVFIRDFELSKGKPRTTLVSKTRSGKPGDGPSRNPAFSDQGFYVAYETDATNILPGDRNGVTDIARANVRPKKAATLCNSNIPWVSRSRQGIGNRASRNPAIALGGCYVVFETASDVFRDDDDVPRDKNGVFDVFLHTAVRNLILLEARQSDCPPFRSNDPYYPRPDCSAKGDRLRLPSTNPAISSKGNYILFETSDPFADVAFARTYYPQWFEDEGRAAYGAARRVGAYHQIYLRYLGGR